LDYQATKKEQFLCQNHHVHTIFGQLLHQIIEEHLVKGESLHTLCTVRERKKKEEKKKKEKRKFYN